MSTKTAASNMGVKEGQNLMREQT